MGVGKTCRVMQISCVMKSSGNKRVAASQPGATDKRPKTEGGFGMKSGAELSPQEEGRGHCL